MKYELHRLGNRKLPFIFRDDEMSAGAKDFTHWHENVELLYFYEGEGLVSVDFKKTLTKAGDLFVINSEKLHMVESANEAAHVRYYCLIIDTDFCTANGIPASELRFKELIRGDGEIEKAFLDVARAYASPGEYRETAVRVAALTLLLLLLLQYLKCRQQNFLRSLKQSFD